MNRVREELNFEFNFNVHLFVDRVANLKTTEERTAATAWVNCLKRVSGTMEEAHLRNDLLLRLVGHCDLGHLGVPFNNKPPTGPLTNVFSVLPEHGGSKAKLKQQKQMDEIEESNEDNLNQPDSSGAFMLGQPAPICGAFCYLAVISRIPKKPSETSIPKRKC